MTEVATLSAGLAAAFDPDHLRYPDYYASGYPDIVLVDDVAMVTEGDIRRLAEYSTSTPTHLGVGKLWKRQVPWNDRNGEWYLCVVHPSADEGYVDIKSYKIARRRLAR